VHEASYVPEPGRPYVDLAAGVLYRMAFGEVVSGKRAPPVRLNARLLRAMRRWSSDRVVDGRVVPGDRYVVQWTGRPANCKGAFGQAVEAAMKAHPTLFRRRDGSPKHIVRHSLRHTGITWVAMDPTLSVEDICSYAGITRAMFDRVYSHHHEAAQAAVIRSHARKRPAKKATT